MNNQRANPFLKEHPNDKELITRLKRIRIGPRQQIQQL